MFNSYDFHHKFRKHTELPVKVRRRQSDAKWRANVANCYETLKNIIPVNKRASKKQISKLHVLQQTDKHIQFLKEILGTVLEEKANRIQADDIDEYKARKTKQIENDFVKTQYHYPSSEKRQKKKRKFLPQEHEEDEESDGVSESQKEYDRRQENTNMYSSDDSDSCDEEFSPPQARHPLQQSYREEPQPLEDYSSCHIISKSCVTQYGGEVTVMPSSHTIKAIKQAVELKKTANEKEAKKNNLIKQAICKAQVLKTFSKTAGAYDVRVYTPSTPEGKSVKMEAFPVLQNNQQKNTDAEAKCEKQTDVIEQKIVQTETKEKQVPKIIYSLGRKHSTSEKGRTRIYTVHPMKINVAKNTNQAIAGAKLDRKDFSPVDNKTGTSFTMVTDQLRCDEKLDFSAPSDEQLVPVQETNIPPKTQNSLPKNSEKHSPQNNTPLETQNNPPQNSEKTSSPKKPKKVAVSIFGITGGKLVQYKWSKDISKDNVKVSNIPKQSTVNVNQEIVKVGQCSVISSDANKAGNKLECNRHQTDSYFGTQSDSEDENIPTILSMPKTQEQNGYVTPRKMRKRTDSNSSCGFTPVKLPPEYDNMSTPSSVEKITPIKRTPTSVEKFTPTKRASFSMGTVTPVKSTPSGQRYRIVTSDSILLTPGGKLVTPERKMTPLQLSPNTLDTISVLEHAGLEPDEEGLLCTEDMWLSDDQEEELIYLDRLGTPRQKAQKGNTELRNLKKARLNRSFRDRFESSSSQVSSNSETEDSKGEGSRKKQYVTSTNCRRSLHSFYDTPVKSVEGTDTLYESQQESACKRNFRENCGEKAKESSDSGLKFHDCDVNLRNISPSMENNNEKLDFEGYMFFYQKMGETFGEHLYAADTPYDLSRLILDTWKELPSVDKRSVKQMAARNQAYEPEITKPQRVTSYLPDLLQDLDNEVWPLADQQLSEHSHLGKGSPQFMSVVPSIDTSHLQRSPGADVVPSFQQGFDEENLAISDVLDLDRDAWSQCGEFSCVDEELSRYLAEFSPPSQNNLISL